MRKSGVLDGSMPFGGEKSWHIGAGRGLDRGMVPGAGEKDRDTGAACRNQFAIICALPWCCVYMDFWRMHLKIPILLEVADKIRPPKWCKLAEDSAGGSTPPAPNGGGHSGV